MGNRAFVIFATKDWSKFSPAVYLHWNGGPESVYAFLKELNHREVRADQEYECARFIQIVGEFFDSGRYYTGLSLGVANVRPEFTVKELAEEFEPGDNGLYVVCRENFTKGWDGWPENERTADEPVVVRRFISGKELSKVKVMAERKVAEADLTFKRIEETFRELDRGRCLESEWMKQIVKPKDEVNMIQAQLETIADFMKKEVK
jgi:hypothetical protein